MPTDTARKNEASHSVITPLAAKQAPCYAATYKTLSILFRSIFLTLLLSGGVLLPSAAATASSTAFLPSQCYMSGSYTQLRELEGLDSAIETTGKFLYSCEHGLIWQTRTPEPELLIYTRSKQNYLVHPDHKVEATQSRAHRYLGSLLNNLIGGDSNKIDKDFSSEVNDQSLTLSPKKRAMKRFLKTIRISRHEHKTHITLQHKNETQTEITVYAVTPLDALEQSHCATLFPAVACTTLLATP